MRSVQWVFGALLAAACAPAHAPERAIGESTRIVASDTAFVLVADSLVPEAIAQHDGILLLGSIARQRVYRAVTSPGAVGSVAPWSPLLGGAVLGMTVDTSRGALWAAVTRPAGRGSGALVALRLAGRTVARTFPLPAEGEHLPNDLALAPDGTIYLTDTDGGVVWSLAPEADSLTIAVPRAPGWTHPNGIALSPDGTMLYVAYDEGIGVARRGERRLRALRAPAGAELGGIDGLYWAGDALVGIQNERAVPQVVYLRLTRGGWEVEKLTVLERGHPAYDAPTTGLLHGGDLLYLANSQVNRWNVKQAIRDTVVVLRLRLP